jgi:tetratricopeptide (TPR) repeat protein
VIPRIVWRRRATGVAAALCLAAAVAVHATQDQRFPGPSVDRPELLYVRSGEAMKRLALGYDGAAADLYWIRVLQHFGHERRAPPTHQRTYALLFPLLDLTTTLDPYFTIAYRFGAIFLGEVYPGGPGRPDLAIALLRKGLAVQPQKWQYMQDLGFVYYWHMQDYPSAAAWFQRAARVSDAPTWLTPLAAVTLAEGGHRGASRSLWLQIAKSEEPWLRDSATQRLMQLDAMDAIDALEARVREFQRIHQSVPANWQPLIAAGYLRGIPVDPAGTPYVILADGHVSISKDSRLWPLPGELRNQAQ